MNHSPSTKLAALLGCAALAAPLSLLAASGPSAEQYVNAAGNNSEWILPAKSYSGNRYVTAAQITPSNVRRLKRIWKFKIDDSAGVETAPIVWNGMVYVTSAHDHVYALNAKTGKLVWEFKDNPHVLAFAANRGVGLMDGNVYVATLDGHLIALDAKTGKKRWDVVAAHDTSNTFYSMAPVPYHNAKTGKDMLLLGASNGDWGGIGYITAFDPKNGDRIWEWKTIPGPGEPGHDSWSGDSWKRGGAAVWSGVAIDPQTDTLYMDLGNPQPDFLGTERKGSNLYSNSMVALDISGDKPTLKWYYQFIPHDTHDWDPAMPPVLFHGKVNGEDRALVAAGDKGGNFWILDAGIGCAGRSHRGRDAEGAGYRAQPRGQYRLPEHQRRHRVQRRQLRSGQQRVHRAERQPVWTLEIARSGGLHRGPVLSRRHVPGARRPFDRAAERDRRLDWRVPVAALLQTAVDRGRADHQDRACVHR